MTEITMPKLSDTMTAGRLVFWKKSVGDRVERGEVIAEVETDKANMELEAFTDGILLETRVAAGDQVAVGTVIGVIGAIGEAAVTPPASPPVTEPPPPAPVRTIPPASVERPAGSQFAPEREQHEGRAAPAVRRHAHDLGIDLSQVPGSGPGGRVLMEDLERFMGVALVAEPEPVPVAGPAGGDVVSASPAADAGRGHPLSRMRAAIVRTVVDSWHTIPHFAVSVEVAMDAEEEVRRELKEGGTPLSVNDFIIKAAALALRRHPRINASFGGDRIITHDSVDIGIAVSLPDGLLVPVIRGCDTLPLREIRAESSRLIAAARSGRLTEPDMAGGTFTISNLGMYGVTGFTAVILPPQAAILAVGTIRETLVPRTGTAVVSPVMTLTLSADHRIIDGTSAAEFLGELRRLLENPVLLLT